MNPRTLRALTLFTVAGLVLTGCGSKSEDSSGSGGGSGASNSEPYRVLVSGAASGPLAPNASVSINSAKAAANEINAAGGIDGRQIEVTVVDDNADPTTAVSALQKAIADNKPDAFMDSGPSTVAAAVLPILTQNKILSFNLGPTADSGDPKTNPYNFDVAQSSATMILGIAADLEDEGFKTVGILHGNSAKGEDFATAGEKGLTAAGLSVVSNEEYDITALDMTPQIEAIKAKNPDVLVLDAYGAPLGYILKNIEKVGWNVPIRGNTSVSATSIVSKPAPDGVLGTDQVKNLKMQVFPSTMYDPSAAGVNKAVQSMLKVGPLQSTIIVAENYDAMYLVKAAAEKAGSADDPAALAKALEDNTVTQKAGTVIVPEYNFSADSHSPNSNGKNFYTFIPPAPIQDGQFRPDSSGTVAGSSAATSN